MNQECVNAPTDKDSEWRNDEFIDYSNTLLDPKLFRGEDNKE